MAIVLVIIGRIYRYQVKCNYLKNQIILLLSIAFLESKLNSEHFEKKLNIMV